MAWTCQGCQRLVPSIHLQLRQRLLHAGTLWLEMGMLDHQFEWLQDKNSSRLWRPMPVGATMLLVWCKAEFHSRLHKS